MATKVVVVVEVAMVVVDVDVVVMVVVDVVVAMVVVMVVVDNEKKLGFNRLIFGSFVFLLIPLIKNNFFLL